MMPMTRDDEVKRWTAKRKSALVLDIIQGKTAGAKASRTHDPSAPGLENRVGDAKRGMENALRAREKLQAPPDEEDK